jgi:hypothetical protein
MDSQQLGRIVKVKRKGIIRGSIAATAVLAPVAGFTALAAGPAAAAPSGITCTKLSGTANLTANTSSTKLSKCTGNTGTKGSSKGTAAPPTSVTFKWANAKTTTIGNIQLATGTLCPATKVFGTQTLPLAADETESGTVSADTTGSTTVGAASDAEVCVYGPDSSGNLHLVLAPKTKFVIAP